MKTGRKRLEDFGGAYVLSHPVRAAVVKLLRKEGEMYTRKIAERLGLSDRLVAFHLSMLTSAGFVNSDYRITATMSPPRVARYYRLTPKVDETLDKFTLALR